MRTCTSMYMLQLDTTATVFLHTHTHTHTHLLSRLKRSGTRRWGVVTEICCRSSRITVTRFHGNGTLTDSSANVVLATGALERLQKKLQALKIIRPNTVSIFGKKLGKFCPNQGFEFISYNLHIYMYANLCKRHTHTHLDFLLGVGGGLAPPSCSLCSISSVCIISPVNGN